jgi:hypothetical protein
MDGSPHDNFSHGKQTILSEQRRLEYTSKEGSFTV